MINEDSAQNTETINITGSITWVDYDNAGQLRPDYTVIHLLSDGTEVRIATVTSANGWVYSFLNMPKYNQSGCAIQYTITEDPINGYSSKIAGLQIVNTRTDLVGSEAEQTAMDAVQKAAPVKTGDHTPLYTIIVLLLLSAGTIIGYICLIQYRKKNCK